MLKRTDFLDSNSNFVEIIISRAKNKIKKKKPKVCYMRKDSIKNSSQKFLAEKNTADADLTLKSCRALLTR